MGSFARTGWLRSLVSACLVMTALVPVPVGAAPPVSAPGKSGEHRKIGLAHRVDAARLPAAARENGPTEAPPRNRRARVVGPARTQGVRSLGLSAGRAPSAGGQAAVAAPTSTFTDPSIEQLTDWNAAGYDKFAPPDTQVAVGPNRVIEMDNVNAYVYGKNDQSSTPSVIKTFGLGAFFGTNATFPAFSDPKVVFDAESNRFFAAGLIFDNCNPAPPPKGSGCTTSNNSAIGLAVSDGTDPAAGWAVYTVASNTSGTLFDQPKLGVTSDKILMSWNDNGTGGPFEFWVIQKSQVVAETSPVDAIQYPDTGHYNIIPALGLTPSTTAYAVSHSTGSGTLTVLSVTGTPSGNNVNTSFDDTGIADMDDPPNALQPGTSLDLDSGDSAIQSAVWKNNRIWATGTDDCKDASDTDDRACVRFIEVSTSGSPSVLQDQDLTLVGGYLIYPSVTLDSANNVWAGFSASSPNTGAGLPGYATATIAFVQGGVLPPVVPGLFFASGSGTYNCTFCFQNDGTTRRPRFGDYSATVVDPTNPTDIWTAQEFGSTSTTNTDLWGTAIGRFTAAAPAITSLNPNHAPELSTDCAPIVTVTGTDFLTGGTSVAFGAVSGTNVTVATSDQLTVNAPAQARGTVHVTATTPNGTSTTSSADVFTYDPDTTPPVSTASALPAPLAGNDGWTRGPVTVAISANDNAAACGSGVKSVSYSTAGAQTIGLTTVPGATASFSLSNEGVTTVSFFATDNANNAEAANSLVVKIDNTAPRVAFTTPPGGEPYLLNQPVTASYACVDRVDGTDGGVGVASCVGTVPNGGSLATTSLGTFTFTVNTADKLGNAAAPSTTYRVTYKICLQYDPSKPVPAGGIFSFRIQVCDFNNVNLTSSAITVTALSVTPPEPLSSPSNPGNVFFISSGVYVYNLRTTGYPTGNFTLNISVSGDPVVHALPFTLK